VGRECSTYGGEVYTGLWWGYLRERDHLVDLGTDRTIIKAESSGSGIGGGMD